MKRVLCLAIAMLFIMSAFAGCGEKNKDKVTLDEPEVPEEPARVFDTPQQEAIVVVAEAYYARRALLQYDDTRLVTGNAVKPVIYRWSRCIDAIENSPEDATSQYTCYTNCAAWVHDVYLEAFNFEIGAWYVGLFHDDPEMQVIVYNVTDQETEEDKAALKAEFIANLQPGDVINCYRRPSGGHTLLYVGDGKILHSAVPNSEGGNYDYEGNQEKWEPNGSVDYTTIDEMFDDPNHRYYLWTKSRFSLTRPLKKFPQMQVSEKTQNRIDNLQNIFVEMTSSHPGSVTADLGEEITFTFTLRNDRKSAATLEVEDIVPAGSTYVSGAEKVDGNKVSWSVKVPAGETRQVSYTVKVNNDPGLYDFGYIFSENAKVGGVNVKCRPVYVGKHLSDAQQKSVSEAAAKVSVESLKGTDLAEKIYKNAGINISLGSAKSMLSGVFKKYKTSTSHKELNPSGTYTKIVAPTMYGGYYVANSDLYYSRTRGMSGHEIMVGDILIQVEGTKEHQTFMYVGENKLMDLDNGKILTADESWKIMMGTVGYDQFAILRPALGF